ncbi:MAG: GNAT family N-acetyltransferase [Verrucomicrobiota bacterium]
MNPDETIETDNGSCSLWWTDVPQLPDEKVGCIGQYEGSGAVEAALARLKEEGCTLAIGPMDGSTWRSYRFVTDFGDEPRFLLEPWNSPEAPKEFDEAGFAPLATYSSSKLPLDPRDLSKIEDRIAKRGIQILSIDVSRFRDELALVYKLSLNSFAENFLYTPIARDEFLAMYGQAEPLVRPEFVQIAENGEGDAIGFVFALPDGDNLVVKTLATHPNWRRYGLGSVLVERVQTAAKEMGFEHAIHALQHQNNSSLKITGRNSGERIREYTLYSKNLR